MGLQPGELKNLAAKNWGTFGNLAFAVNYKPGAPDEAPLLKLARAAVGETDQTKEVPDERLVVIRRLHFEAYTLASADMRSRVEERGDEPPRKLAAPERNQRDSEQKGRLPGVAFDKFSTCSHALVDAVVKLHDANQMEYIRWEQCTTRHQELMGVKLDPMWKPDSHGVVREVHVARTLTADLGSDLLLRYALQRRALAFDNAGLVDYRVFERWHSVLAAKYVEKAMEGHRAISLEQLQRADVALFVGLMDKTRGGIRQRADGTRPLDEAMTTLMDSPDVMWHLMPLQGGPSVSKAKPATSDSRDAVIDNLKKEVAALKRKGAEGPEGGSSGSRPDEPVSGQQGRKKKQNKRSGSRFVRMPRELLGGVAVDDSGASICFDFNMTKGCGNATDGAWDKCPKGRHVCCAKGCFSKNHNFVTCTHK